MARAGSEQALSKGGVPRGCSAALLSTHAFLPLWLAQCPPCYEAPALVKGLGMVMSSCELEPVWSKPGLRRV